MFIYFIYFFLALFIYLFKNWSIIQTFNSHYIPSYTTSAASTVFPYFQSLYSNHNINNNFSFFITDPNALGHTYRRIGGRGTVRRLTVGEGVLARGGTCSMRSSNLSYQLYYGGPDLFNPWLAWGGPGLTLGILVLYLGSTGYRDGQEGWWSPRSRGIGGWGQTVPGGGAWSPTLISRRPIALPAPGWGLERGVAHFSPDWSLIWWVAPGFAIPLGLWVRSKCVWMSNEEREAVVDVVIGM